MKISRDNYESWFLDYFEGNLDEALVDEFIEFLQQNPDLKEELLLLEPATPEPDNLRFSGKERLYKEVYDLPEAFDEAAVAWLEGDLEPAQADRFNEYMGKHPEKQSELELFRLTRLNPDSTVHFPKKNRLYRQPAGRKLVMWSLRAAAVLLLGVAVYAAVEQLAISSQSAPEVAEAPAPVTPAAPLNPDKQPSSPQLAANLPQQSRAVSATNKQQPAVASPPVAVTVSEEHLPAPRPVADLPVLLPAKTILLKSAVPPTALAAMQHPEPEVLLAADEQPDDRALSDKLIEKAGLNDFRFSKLARSGLDLAAGLTNEKFSYQTNEAGQVTAFYLDTRLVGFSIPVKRR